MSRRLCRRRPVWVEHVADHSVGRHTSRRAFHLVTLRFAERLPVGDIRHTDGEGEQYKRGVECGPGWHVSPQGKGLDGEVQMQMVREAEPRQPGSSSGRLPAQTPMINVERAMPKLEHRLACSTRCASVSRAGSVRPKRQAATIGARVDAFAASALRRFVDRRGKASSRAVARRGVKVGTSGESRGLTVRGGARLHAGNLSDRRTGEERWRP